jgi:hypothetical protein
MTKLFFEQLRGAPWVNVMDYGADPTGATYSDDAFDQAIDSRTDRSAAVIIPPGTYKFAAPIVLGNSTVLLGTGSNMTDQVSGASTLTYRPHVVLSFPNATDGIIAPDDATVTYRCHGCIISGVTIKGSASTNGKRGIWLRDNASSSVAIQRCGLIQVEKVFIENFGTGIDGDNTADSTTIRQVHVHNCAKGIVGGSSETRIEAFIPWSLTTGPAIELNDDRAWVLHSEIQPLVGNGVVVNGDYCIIANNSFGDLTNAVIVNGNDNIIVGNAAARNIAGTAWTDNGSNNRWAANSPAATGDAGSVGLTVQDENGTIATGVTQLDFQGAGVTAAAGTGEVVVTVTGSSASSGYREVVMESGVTPPTPILNSAGDDWVYGEAEA